MHCPLQVPPDFWECRALHILRVIDCVLAWCAPPLPDRPDSCVCVGQCYDSSQRQALDFSEFCKLAIVETKNRATDLIEDLEKRLADVQGEVDNPVTVNLNGCPNACARTQVSDIGLKGQLVTDADGNQVEGFQVHLGGGLGHDPGFGRKIRGHKVTSAELGDYVERLVRRYLDQRSEDELFRQWVDRVGDEELK